MGSANIVRAANSNCRVRKSSRGNTNFIRCRDVHVSVVKFDPAFAMFRESLFTVADFVGVRAHSGRVAAREENVCTRGELKLHKALFEVDDGESDEANRPDARLPRVRKSHSLWRESTNPMKRIVHLLPTRARNILLRVFSLAEHTGESNSGLARMCEMSTAVAAVCTVKL